MTETIIIVVLLVAWSAWGLLSSRVEQTEYSVVRRTADYEVREYPAHLVAQTTVQGTYRDAVGAGFRIIAGYIFGGNTKKESIAMTAPVVAQGTVSEKIAMTAPVVASQEGGAYTITFGMPRGYTLEALPVPNDSRVRLVEVPLKKVAAARFSGWRTDARETRVTERLTKSLARDRVVTHGSFSYAGYNAPWTPPWLQRHEVLVELQ